jgi:hypothetical protein
MPSAKSRQRPSGPDDGPSIPDPLGDDSRVAASGSLTSGSREREGLLRSGSTPLPDGGVDQHPVHDEDAEDELDAEAYEKQVDEARNTGFEPLIDDDAPEEDRDSEDEDEA